MKVRSVFVLNERRAARPIFRPLLCFASLAFCSWQLSAAQPVINHLTLPGSGSSLNIQSDVGVINQIEYTTNLDSWTILTNVSVTQSTYDLLDQSASHTGQRYYRLRAFPPSTPAGNGMVLIPAGSFAMGDSFSEGDGSERPVHTVQVSDFYMETNLVTDALWNRVYNWSLSHGYTYYAPYYAKATNYPISMVWDVEVQRWCNARSEMEGLTPCYYTDPSQTSPVRRAYTSATNNACVKWTANGYRMPTEAEWEKAARGGASGLRFPWGNIITRTNANYTTAYYISYDISPVPKGPDPLFYDPSIPWQGCTSPVGYFGPNGYGLKDMAGNGYQWCWDWYATNSYSVLPAADPHGPDNPTDVRVVRGGSWYFDATHARCAARGQGASGPNNWLAFTFRCVRTQ